MYNNPYMNPYNTQANIDRLNEQINNLEKMKAQLQQPPQQPTNLTQNFQLAPTSRDVIRYASSLEEDEEILSIPPEGITIADINDSEQREKIMCDFTIKQVIGEGTFATVRLAVNKQTEEQVAIKIMEKSKIVQKEDKVRIEREIKVLKNLRHPNIGMG